MAKESNIDEIDVIMHMHGSSNQMYFNDTKKPEMSCEVTSKNWESVKSCACSTQQRATAAPTLKTWLGPALAALQALWA